jgi:hypothetical protein
MNEDYSDSEVGKPVVFKLPNDGELTEEEINLVKKIENVGKIKRQNNPWFFW